MLKMEHFCFFIWKIFVFPLYLHPRILKTITKRRNEERKHRLSELLTSGNVADITGL